MEDIKKWLLSDMDFSAGAALFSKYCKNKTLVRSITINPRNAKKLEYELKKLAGIPVTLLFNQKCSNKELLKIAEKGLKRTIIKATQQKENQNINVNKKNVLYAMCTQTTAPTYNDPIAKAKKRLSEWYIKIDKMHRQLYDLGESNAPDVVKKRLAILQKRKPIIQKCDELYRLKEAYFDTGKYDPRIAELLKN